MANSRRKVAYASGPSGRSRRWAARLTVVLLLASAMSETSRKVNVSAGSRSRQTRCAPAVEASTANSSLSQTERLSSSSRPKTKARRVGLTRRENSRMQTTSTMAMEASGSSSIATTSPDKYNVGFLVDSQQVLIVSVYNDMDNPTMLHIQFSWCVWESVLLRVHSDAGAWPIWSISSPPPLSIQIKLASPPL